MVSKSKVCGGARNVKAKEAAFYGSPEWNAVMDHARSHIARTVVQTMEPFLNVTGDSLRRGNGKLCELRIYTISRGMVEPWAKFHTGTLIPVLRKPIPTTINTTKITSFIIPPAGFRN